MSNYLYYNLLHLYLQYKLRESTKNVVYLTYKKSCMERYQTTYRMQ